jgi:hypothetical protein
MSVNTKERTWLVRLKENVTLDARTQRIVTRIMLDKDGQKPPPTICIEPAKIPIGVMSASAVSQVMSATVEKSNASGKSKDYACACY